MEDANGNDSFNKISRVFLSSLLKVAVSPESVISNVNVFINSPSGAGGANDENGGLGGGADNGRNMARMHVGQGNIKFVGSTTLSS
jgi:hypothetical protein